MTMADVSTEPPYTSLEAMRRANDELLSSLPDEELHRPISTEVQDTIKRFIRRAVETGTVLDTPADRRAAQGLIDYWVASAYAIAGDRSLRQSPLGRNSIMLKPFTPEIVDSAAQRGEAVITALSPKDQAIARHILQGLFRLPEEATSVVTSRTLRDSLVSRDDARANEILDRLADAGVLDIEHTDRGDLVELKYDALARRWDRLRRWIGARTKLRDAAMFWANSGGDKRALISADLLEEADSFGALNKQERDFVKASRDHSRKWLAIRFVMAGVLLCLLPFAYGIFTFGQEKYIEYKAKQWNEILKSEKPSKEKVEAIRELASNGLPVDLTSGKLNDVTIEGIKSNGAIFVDARLNNVTVKDAGLTFADFSRSQIGNGTFQNVKLDSSRFGGAILAKTTFTNVNLYRSIFDRVLFCQGVKLVTSDLRAVSVRNVVFDGDNVPEFDGSAWWLAVGWSMKQHEQIREEESRRYKEGKRLKYEDTPAFSREIEEFDDQLKTAKEPTLFRADRLNAKAWSLATYGTNLSGAEKSSLESLTIIQAAKSLDPRYEAEYTDTLAYILMQNGKTGDALKKMTDALEKVPSEEQSGEWIFRYAILQFAEGEKDKSLKNLALAINVKKYTPSHELYLVNQYIQGDFRTSLETLTASDQPPGPNGSSCPATSPAG